MQQPVPSSVVVPMFAAGVEQRRAARFGVGMPYILDGVEGQTTDLSATGLSFESDTFYPVGAIVKLTLRYAMDGHNFPLPCEVEVMRVEPAGRRFQIAARLSSPFFDGPA